MDYTTDADEFLQIGTQAGTLESFREAVGTFDVVSFSSSPFGSNGIDALEDRPVMEQFTRLSRTLGSDDTAILTSVKTLIRNSVAYDARRNHRPVYRNFSTSGLRWIDGSGRDFPPEFTDSRIKIIDSRSTTKFAWFNHYAIKSRDAYLVKIDRGDANGALHRQRSHRYWNGYDAAGDIDIRAATLRPAAQEILSSFHRHPLLHELHLAAFATHQSKAAAHRLAMAREAEQNATGASDAVG